MILFIQKGIRGGISQCSNRYAKANNPYMKSGYNPHEDQKYLMYFDVNNLYGWAMQQYLPKDGFAWVPNVKKLEDELLKSNYISDIDEKGYILEVDLDYPRELHDKHNDLPFCAEHIAPTGSKHEKLLTTLYDKKRYILHYRALQQALKHGLKLRKIHRALSFNQEPWLKEYIDLNTAKRQKANNEFEKMLFKLFNNAVFGKTMENERKRIDVKLRNHWDGRYGVEALIARPNFHSCTIFNEDLVAIQLRRKHIFIKKPIYVGLSVLDISKTCVYDFHYGYMLNDDEKDKRVGTKNCKLLYTDTDSLSYEVTNVDMYEVIKRDSKMFDTSGYPKDNPYGIKQANKFVVGIMKEELDGDVMLEFAGNGSKCYAVRIQNRENILKNKGIKSHIVQATIGFSDYIECLKNNKSMTREQCHIRSHKHVIYTEKETKIAMNPHDDKRFLQSGTTDTLAWGHYSIIQEEREMKNKRRRTSEEKASNQLQEIQTDKVGGYTIVKTPKVVEDVVVEEVIYELSLEPSVEQISSEQQRSFKRLNTTPIDLIENKRQKKI